MSIEKFKDEGNERKEGVKQDGKEVREDEAILGCPSFLSKIQNIFFIVMIK